MNRVRTLPGVRVFDDSRVQLFVAIVFLLLVAFMRLGQIWYSASQYEIGYDFSAYWLAGRHALDGMPLYTDGQLAGSYPAQQQFLYLYPPFLAAIVAPLSAIYSTFESAAWVWSALGLILFCSSIAAVARTERCSWPLTIALVAVGLALPPVALEIYIGNVHILLLALLSLAWIALRRKPRAGDGIAGVAIGAATLIKLFPGLVIVWLFLTGRRRATWISIAAVVVLALATIPLVGLDDWLNYPRVAINIAPPTDPSNVLAPTSWLTASLGFTVARFLVTAIGLALMVWSTLRQPAIVSYAVTVLVSLLIVPALYLHYVALVALPLLLLFLSGARGRYLAATSYVLLFVTTQFLIGNSLSDVARAAATVALVLTLLLMLAAGQNRDQDEQELTSLRPLSA